MTVAEIEKEFWEPKDYCFACHKEMLERTLVPSMYLTRKRDSNSPIVCPACHEKEMRFYQASEPDQIDKLRRAWKLNSPLPACGQRNERCKHGPYTADKLACR